MTLRTLRHCGNDVFRAKPIKPKVNSKKSKKVTVMSATELLTGGVEEAYELADIVSREPCPFDGLLWEKAPEEVAENTMMDPFSPPQLESIFATANSAYEAWVWLHRVIDFRLNEKKAVPPFIEIPVLGLDIAIDDDKRAQLISSIDGVLQDDRLPSSTAHKLIEKLTFASGALDTSAPRWLTIFVGNTAVEYAPIKGSSSCPLMNKMISSFWANVARLQLKVWVARVGSKSNPSDTPSPRH
ncbi:hypothetical protein Pmar_PMAR012983 [Perkinsus marinus ATCC 50983]|uniref:Uncharacterized protein n=1 Tax=Perkinsus marinus (strain ATCC 50983 / TXsc) TaxID=423536 RepID=C5KZC7_PERM5|nr:hypothetical protein Pmar_PMAR012983 [Perkinsus marinus ATCC 50983]EER10158.1 hypothetical protein Pmar_PMAR012983 [Perkinsus marinus ATCC 50983]|eukprot:XP_002778363.1 hypothetical protein Pmar_PMAR012983 [Perkinsus marinus ATCC 50983]